MKGFVRAFVALELPAEIQSRLNEIISHLKRDLDGLPMRWVKPENIHLTLKFIGDLAEEQTQEVSHLVETEAKGQKPFEVALSKLGVFPDVRRPRVLWVGLHAPHALPDFQQRLEQGLGAMGYEREQRRFSPHLTMARFKRSLNRAGLDALRSSLERTNLNPSGGIVDSITLFKSELKPDGPVYNRLVQFKLEGPT
ncbi:MAG: RNA 2',3'-cyclic phosphodiesterase [Anaerolineales bacterium]